MRRVVPVLLVLTLIAAPVASQDKGPPPKTPLDQAIDGALQYLAANQDREGAWSASYRGKNPAITALAVMAFLSAGHVPGEGRYGEVVRKGVEYVLRSQAPNGLIATEGHYEMYQHGICTLMLAEVVGMTEGKLADEVRKKLERAVLVILKGQRTSGFHKGGWRYQVHGTDSDISVTGWQLMALRAAKNVGCDVPPEAIERAVEYVKRCQDPSNGGFRYMVRAGVTVPCTGTSILGLELCGKEEHRSPEVLKAGSYLLRNLPRWGDGHFFYTIYYCTQATFQLGGNYWDAYRPRMREILLQNQADNGSWTGRWGEDLQLGPSYGTAIAILALTVEYRYLPIYQRGEEPAEMK